MRFTTTLTCLAVTVIIIGWGRLTYSYISREKNFLVRWKF